MSTTAADVVEFPEIAGRPFVEQAPGAPSPAPAGALEPAPLEVPGDVIEWTPERAAAIARGFGYVLHSIDPAGSLDGAEELWRATEAEADEIGAPLARILARYEPARRLAGVVDEVELGAAFVGYAKRNMALRGRVVLAHRDPNPQPVVEVPGESELQT